MPDQHHVIQKQTLDITLSPDLDAKRLQKELSALNQQQIIPVLDGVCQDLPLEDRIVRINRLELDLGVMGYGNFQKTLVEKIRQTFQERLHQLLSQEPLHASRPEIEETSFTDSHVELLEYFLYTGALPWWRSQLEEEPLETLFRKLLEEQPEAIRNRIRSGLSTEPFRKRLAYQFSTDILASVWEILQPTQAQPMQNFFHPLLAVLQKADRLKDVEPPILRAHLAYVVWTYLVKPPTTFRAKPFIHDLIKNLARVLNLSFGELLQQIQLISKTSPKAQKTVPASLRAQLHTLVPSGTSPGKEKTSEPVAKTDKDKKRPLKAKTKPIPKREDEIYLQNSGLVILSAYLPKFFENLGLLVEHPFIDVSAAHRAVYLLQYLAAGQGKYPEYSLSLNKLLCGLDLAAPLLPPPPKWSEQETCVVQKLLNAVIKNWSALKNTSVNGLREAFLLRDGKLQSTPDAWQLHVEQKAYDILLDRIPWNIHLIKLPWMPNPLHVLW